MQLAAQDYARHLEDVVSWLPSVLTRKDGDEVSARTLYAVYWYRFGGDGGRAAADMLRAPEFGLRVKALFPRSRRERGSQDEPVHRDIAFLGASPKKLVDIRLRMDAWLDARPDDAVVLGLVRGGPVSPSVWEARRKRRRRTDCRSRMRVRERDRALERQQRMRPIEPQRHEVYSDAELEEMVQIVCDGILNGCRWWANGSQQ